jgi:hypothetical protein
MQEQPPYQPPYQPSYPPPQEPPGPPSHQAEIWRGIGLALLLHLIQIPLAAVTVFISLIFLGLSQLLYIVPAIFIYRNKGRPGVVKGLIIAAAITFLLNATCTALVFSNLNIH